LEKVETTNSLYQPLDSNIARAPIDATTILNCLPANVSHPATGAHPALSLLPVGPSPMLARLTRLSAVALDLAAGKQAWLPIKAVALIG
jgi:molybdate transport system ATP-binding protein